MNTVTFTYCHTAASSLFTVHRSPAEKHAFSSKERDVETGLSYFGARYYSSDLSLWLSVDPMSGKYPHQSNYVYCSNNPLQVIDPNGEDEWDLARDGTLTKRENGRTDVDIVYATTKEGKSINRYYKAGSINNNPKIYKGVLYAGTKNEKEYTTHYMSFSDNDVATDFFEFAAENCDVEWALKASNTESFVGTTHNDFSVMPAPKGAFLDVHSHSDDPSHVIGSDVGQAYEAFNKGITFKVYEAGKKSYATYNPDSYKLDGPREMSKNLRKSINLLIRLIIH